MGIGLPRWLLTHRVTVEPYEGANAYGPVFGPPVEYRAFVSPARERDQDDQDEERAVETTVYFELGAHVPTGSRLTHNGWVSTAARVMPRDGGGLTTPDHVEVTTK